MGGAAARPQRFFFVNSFVGCILIGPHLDDVFFPRFIFVTTCVEHCGISSTFHVMPPSISRALWIFICSVTATVCTEQLMCALLCERCRVSYAVRQSSCVCVYARIKKHVLG